MLSHTWKKTKLIEFTALSTSTDNTSIMTNRQEIKTKRKCKETGKLKVISKVSASLATHPWLGIQQGFSEFGIKCQVWESIYTYN